MLSPYDRMRIGFARGRCEKSGPEYLIPSHPASLVMDPRACRGKEGEVMKRVFMVVSVSLLAALVLIPAASATSGAAHRRSDFMEPPSGRFHLQFDS